MAEQKLLDQVRSRMTLQNYAESTIETYTGWMRRYILFHHKRHPREMNERDVETFLSAMAMQGKVSASTQNQAFSALLYLYRDVLNIDLNDVDALRARKPKRVPVVFSVNEVGRVLNELHGPVKLAAMLMYGGGLRLMEAMTLRVKDVDFGQRTITVHDGKGGKDRVTLLPMTMHETLQRQIEIVRANLALDVARGFGGATMPNALGRKYPNAPKELAWQYILPADHLIPSLDGSTLVRHHLHESVTQKAVHAAIQRAGIYKQAGCHTFRHSFATHALQSGMDIRTLQELMGHTDVRTTMGYLHVEINAGTGDRSPLDALSDMRTNLHNN
jgi:integron integrase